MDQARPGRRVLVAVVAIAFGLDTGFLTRVSLSGTTALEQAWSTGSAPAEASRARRCSPPTVMSGDRR